ncbi:MAG TPA: AGE family epimerase/isomerase [Phycisphaerae bacterium]|nr:AGE family epimerase/isomerase [Phycisphaerae bacterium]
MDFGDLLNHYRTTLLGDVVPFWMRHAIDPAGGINSCITDDGQVVSRDKWSWSQWRAVWVFSKLYNRIDKRSEWLHVARNICDFLTSNGPLDDGHWPLLLDGDGKVLRGYESVYADGFAIYALAELYRATREQRVIDLAMSTFQAAEADINAATPPPAWPYPIKDGCIAHGISMLFSLAYHELALVTGDAVVRAAADIHHRRVMKTFLRDDRGLVLECLYRDGREYPAPDGTVVLPGHAIESMWFQMHIARDADNQATIERSIQAIRKHLEIGWDNEFGGLFLAVDAEDRPDVAWRFPDSKLWWPHTEALYATLLAYEHSREPWCIEWYRKLHDYSFSHYPVREHGEWTQKLDRRGRPIKEVVALPVKDPFHLPRAIIYCIDVLERLTSAGR